jgi:hypothetical protein
MDAGAARERRLDVLADALEPGVVDRGRDDRDLGGQREEPLEVRQRRISDASASALRPAGEDARLHDRRGLEELASGGRRLQWSMTDP